LFKKIIPMKKATKRRTTKRPKKITGLEASLLSFRARNRTTPVEFDSFGENLSKHVRGIVFSAKKRKAARKTLDEIRKVADENRRRLAANPRQPRSDFHSLSSE
jgi:hypothetical protein